MNSHWRYLKYVLRHRWFVFVECCKLGIPWRGVMHDLSKFLPREWFPYVDAFYRRPSPRDATGSYDPTKVSPEFDRAWLLHQRNRHHWQAWILIGDNGSLKPLEMPTKYCKEMLADWRGAGQAQRKPDTVGWYLQNRHRMVLGIVTRAWIEDSLSVEEGV